MQKGIETLKNFWSEHKITVLTLALIATSAIVYGQNAGIKQMTAFLKEKNLYGEYFMPED